MHAQYFQKYEELIETYEKLFHLNSNECIDTASKMITDVLISKYQIKLQDLIMSLMVAAKYNYRSVYIYAKLLNQLFINNSIKRLMFENIFNYATLLDLTIFTDVNGIFQIEIHNDLLPKENESTRMTYASNI